MTGRNAAVAIVRDWRVLKEIFPEDSRVDASCFDEDKTLGFRNKAGRDKVLRWVEFLVKAREAVRDGDASSAALAELRSLLNPATT